MTGTKGRTNRGAAVCANSTWYTASQMFLFAHRVAESADIIRRHRRAIFAGNSRSHRRAILDEIDKLYKLAATSGLAFAIGDDALQKLFQMFLGTEAAAANVENEQPALISPPTRMAQCP
jgi:hypothetical protein